MRKKNNDLMEHARTLIPYDAAIPTLYATQNDSDPMVHIKLFTPDGSWSWYVLEYDSEERLCFGYVDGFDGELGYFSIAELESVRGGLGLSVERDSSFSPIRLSEVKKL